LTRGFQGKEEGKGGKRDYRGGGGGKEKTVALLQRKRESC